MTVAHRAAALVISLLAATAVTFGAGWLGYQSARADGSGSAAVDAGSASAPVAAPLPDAPDPGTVIKLWQSGAFLAAGALTLFLLLTLALRLDDKRAFYYTAGLTGLAGIVDLVAAGHKLTWSAVIVALTTIASIVVKGPRLGKA